MSSQILDKAAAFQARLNVYLRFAVAFERATTIVDLLNAHCKFPGSRDSRTILLLARLSVSRHEFEIYTHNFHITCRATPSSNEATKNRSWDCEILSVNGFEESWTFSEDCELVQELNAFIDSDYIGIVHAATLETQHRSLCSMLNMLILGPDIKNFHFETGSGGGGKGVISQAVGGGGGSAENWGAGGRVPTGDRGAGGSIGK